MSSLQGTPEDKDCTEAERADAATLAVVDLYEDDGDYEEVTWFYSQKTGSVLHNDEIAGCGYSGNDLNGGQCKNNPDAEAVHNHGPIPRGTYRMIQPFDHPKVGHFAIPLAPSMDNQMFGRMGFFVHGDSQEHPGDASDGCIVADLSIRMRMWSSGDHDLEVTE